MKFCKDSSKPSAICLAICLLVSLIQLVAVSDLRADEPAEKFLNALRERGYFQAALHYLDGAGQSAVVPEDFRKRVAFEKAKILIDSVASIRKSDEISKRLDQADQLLTQYASSVSDPIETTEVNKIQANVRYFRGRNYLKQASLDRTGAAQKPELYGQAKKFLGDAVPKFRQVQKSQRDQIENFQIDPEDPNSDEQLRQLQASYVDTRLKIPVAMEKYALSFEGNDNEKKNKLVEAGKEFEAVAKLYDQRFVQGQMATAFAAKCFQQAGDNGKSFELLKKVFDYPNAPKLLVLEGLNVGVETWPAIEPYPFKEVIEAAEQPVALLTRRDKSNPAWLRIQLELARAKHEQSVAVKKEDSKASSRLKKEASRLAREVARKRSPHSKLAAEMLGGWGVSVTAAEPEMETAAVSSKATSFEDAKQKSKDIVEPLSQQLTELGKLQREVARMSYGAGKSNKELEVEKLKASVNKRADLALAMLAQAVRMANDETSRADLNNVRYLQAYSHFAKGRYDSAAVIGKFLMEKYPTIEWSQQAAGLMVRSYERMFDAATGPARESARGKVIESANGMLNRWPESAESSSASVSATRVAVIDEDFEAAKDFFSKIPQDSPNRAALAARLGQQIWGDRKTAADETAKQTATENAKGFLAIASEEADPATMDFSTGVAWLYYIDACRETGDVDTAVARAEALLQGIDANEVVGKNPKYRQSVYNSTLNAYLEAIKTKPDFKKWTGKARGVIERLAGEAKGDPKALENVSRIYRKMARDLKDKFESLSNINEKQNFADGLKSFFSGIGSGAKDGKTRLWAGSTLLSIAESLKMGGGEEKGKELAAEAISLLDAAKKAGFGNDKGLELNYQHQLALAQRSSGNYEASISSFEKILEKTNGLNLQIDAAKTLLMWGVDKKDTKALTSSMNGRGQYRDPKTKKVRKRIWGWKTLVSLTRSKESFREQFRECEYNSVLCRLRYGEIANSKKAIESAKGELEKALKRFDDLAIGAWKNKYDQLLKDLDSALKRL